MTGNSTGSLRNAITHAIFPLGTVRDSGPLLAIARPFVWTVPIVAFLGLLGALLEGVGVGLLVPFLYVSLDQELPTSLPPALRPLIAFTQSLDPAYRLTYVGIAILALVLLKALVAILSANIIAAIEGRVGAQIRDALATKLLHINYAYFLQHEPAHLVNIVATDSWRASDAVRMIFAIATATAAIVVLGTLLLLIEWRLFLIMGVGVALLRWGYIAYGRRLHRVSERVSDTNRALAERMLNLIVAIRLIMVFGREKYEGQRFRDASEDVRASMFAIERATLVVGPIFEFLLACLLVAALLLSLKLSVELPVAAMFLVLLYRLQPHLISINQSRIGLASIRGSTQQVEWLLGQSETRAALASPLQEPRAPVATAECPGLGTTPIRFDDVTFVFPGSDRREAALSNASFVIEPSKITALIGRSGAGKTTIVNLLCRLLTADSGMILAGETDISRIDLDQWRQRIAIAGQDFDLMEGTVGDNIAYGRPGATEAEIVDALRLADAESFVAGLPLGLATPLGMRGVNLSGGQRQRLGLARALLRRPQLLILDEATNAVDGISENAIIRLLRDQRCFETGIIISHRRSTLAACELGVVLSQGQVIESGPLDTLQYVHAMEAESPVAHKQPS